MQYRFVYQAIKHYLETEGKRQEVKKVSLSLSVYYKFHQNVEIGKNKNLLVIVQNSFFHILIPQMIRIQTYLIRKLNLTIKCLIEQ